MQRLLSATKRRAMVAALVAVLVATALNFSLVPAAFAEPDSDPNSPTTTTTTPAPPTTTQPPGPPTTPPSAPPTNPGANATPRDGAGPPGVRGPSRPPTDSLDAATAELALLQGYQVQLSSDRTRLLSEITEVEAASVEALAERRRARIQRRDRAVAAYRGSFSGPDFEKYLQPSVDDQRLATLARAADRADARRISSESAKLRALETRHDDATAALVTNASQSARFAAQIDGVVAKLAAVSAGVTLISSTVPADPSPSDLGRSARETGEALQAVSVASAQALAATIAAQVAPTDPALASTTAAAVALLSTKTADYAAKRLKLSGIVAGISKKEPAAFDAVWALTPTPALRAMYFALSQVGKEWIYAAAGPNSYDCSGLMLRAWAENGIKIPHFSGSQLNVGVRVPVSELRPGDMLAYGPNGSEHVVMYIGLGFDVEAKGRAWGLVIEPADTDISTGWFAGASRLMP